LRVVPLERANPPVLKSANSPRCRRFTGVSTSLSGMVGDRVRDVEVLRTRLFADEAGL